MRTILMMVLEVGTYQSNEVGFAKDDDMLEKLSPTAADPPLGHRILPGTAIRRPGWFRAHRPHEPHDGRIEDAVSIEDQLLGRGVERERLPQLLDHPS